MNNTQTRSKYLRAQITLPKLTGVDYFKTSKHRLIYEQLLGSIWREFIKRLEDPIKVTESKTSRRVEVLGLARYYINHRTQQVTCRTKQGQFLEDGWHFSFKPTANVMIDPPFVCNKTIIGHFVNLWIKDIDHLTDLYFTESQVDLNIELMDCVETILSQITHAIYTAICASAYWKRLRQDVFKVLSLDPEFVCLSRLSRLTSKVRNLSELHFNHVCKHANAYRQIFSDAPNLLWLYSIAIEENILTKVGTNPILDLKKYLLDNGGTQRAWRILANAKQRDFDVVINSNRRWYYLLEYLQLHERLDRSQVISPRLATLFDNPIWSLPCNNNLIIYRGAEFQPTVFNKFIDETLRIHNSADFAEKETTSVLTWLAQTKAKFDANQQRQPWAWFAKKASEWFAEQLAFDQLNSLSWECGLRESEFSGYLFTPLTSAWLVRIEAVKQRHCVDQYIDRCLEGTYRVFSVQHIKNKTAYTLGLSLCDEYEWEIDQLKGFANRTAADSLWQLCQAVANGLDILEEGALKAMKDQERLQAERLRHQRPEDTRFRRWTIP
ncbi:MAG: hypothetical protein ABL919_15945 [Methylococcales bacterium]